MGPTITTTRLPGSPAAAAVVALAAASLPLAAAGCITTTAAVASAAAIEATSLHIRRRSICQHDECVGGRVSERHHPVVGHARRGGGHGGARRAGHALHAALWSVCGHVCLPDDHVR